MTFALRGPYNRAQCAVDEIGVTRSRAEALQVDICRARDAGDHRLVGLLIESLGRVERELTEMEATVTP